MKLRNKKTGLIGNLISAVSMVKYKICNDDFLLLGEYNSLAEIIDEWEDYAPKEPLIDNEEIREIIRAWAKVNDAMKLKYDYDENSLDDIYRNTITFNRGLGLEDGKKYTITELCGDDKNEVTQ